MEFKDDEFQTLRLRVEQLSSELDKQNTVRVVNTKWMIIVGAVILSALGFTSFVQVPREAERAVAEKVGEDIMDRANKLVEISEIVKTTDLVNLPIGTIIPSMLKPSLFAKTVADPSKWVLADGTKDLNDSQYYTLTAESRTPDLRGMFLRGMNEGRSDGKQDPEQNRTAGDYQSDALQKHGHKTDAKNLIWDKQGDVGYKSNNENSAKDAEVYEVTGPNTKTDIETRPKNVAVYFYIKIN